MAAYPSRYEFLAPRSAIHNVANFIRGKRGQLANMWAAEFQLAVGPSAIAGINLAPFSFLFDTAGNRLISASGIVDRHHDECRDNSRQKGYPKPVAGDVKGHAIAHSIGGGFDLNIFPQDRGLNGSSFRILENKAMKHPGSFYFVRLLYKSKNDRPFSIEQGLLLPDTAENALDVRTFEN